LSYRSERYRLHNEAAKRFFADFSKDPVRRDAVLRERAARRRIPCVGMPFLESEPPVERLSETQQTPS
jgi:hypothetical protein